MESGYKDIIAQANLALQNNDPDGFISFCSDHIKWTMLGETPMDGKDDVLKFLEPMKGTKPAVLNMQLSIQEGNLVASTGSMKMPDDGPEMLFCDIYRFVGDKIEEIQSYIVEVKDGKKIK